MPEQTANLNGKGSRNVWLIENIRSLCHKDKCEGCLEKRDEVWDVCPLSHILTISKFTLDKRTYIFSPNGCSPTICPVTCSDTEDKAWAWLFCPKACIFRVNLGSALEIPISLPCSQKESWWLLWMKLILLKKTKIDSTHYQDLRKNAFLSLNITTEVLSMSFQHGDPCVKMWGGMSKFHCSSKYSKITWVVPKTGDWGRAHHLSSGGLAAQTKDELEPISL